MLLLASLVVLTLGAWALTIYQAQTMDMPMGIAVRGAADSPKRSASDDAMESMPGMVMGEPGTDNMGDMASASMSGMSGMGWTWDAFLAFVIAWAVMMTAMMFPSIAPMLLLFQNMATRRKATGTAFVPTWIFALGYLVVWTVIGVATWVLIQIGSDLVSRMSMAGRETWVRTGAPWRDLPERYGAWQTVYRRFRRWREAGLWDRILLPRQAEAAHEGTLDGTLSMIDGSNVRAHQQTAGAAKKGAPIPR